MPPPQATADLYQQLQQYQLLLLVAGRRLWQGMRPDAMDVSWQRIVARLVAFTAGAQLAAAQAGVAYVPAVLEETGQPDEPLASVRPQAFSGVASDGRSLEGLLTGALVTSKRAAASERYVNEKGRRVFVRGMDGGDALELGQKWLETALRTAVEDAARDATAASIAARPGLGWVRMVNPPCCSRCAVLAGRVYRWNDGFLRHPGCDCLHIPSTVANADSFLADPNELVRRGLVTDLSQNQRDRLADGANLPRVLNESRDRWRERMAADRRARGPVDRLGRRRGADWAGWNAGGTNPPPVGTTIHQLIDRLTSQVEAARAMRAAGIAD